MKKIFLTSILICTIFLSGCSKYSEKDVVKDLNKKLKNVPGYQIEGTMEIYNGDNTYKYDVTSSYEKDKYRVSLINKTNNHEQIILKNDDGVYVLTPSLNKSFKFQSDWPNNNSQVYLLKSILKDINKDKNISMEKNGNNYILKNKISYSNNKKYDNQKIYMDKNLNFKKIEVFDKQGNIQIKMNFKNIDLNATFNNKYFSTEENMKTSESMSSEENESKKSTNDINSNNNKTTTNNNTSEEDELNEEETSNEEEMSNESASNESNESASNESNESASNESNESEDSSESTETTPLLEETIYPMFLPEGTYLSTEETVSKEEGERVILTFAGESPFILVEENAKRSSNMEIIPVYGEPTMLIDSIGAMSDNSVNFISNGIEYYIASENLSKEDTMNVVESINSVAIMK